ncbi:carboxymuconolactone decarboxylase family protein [Thiotrichales bacterium 19S3-7]|nr:carboxymuconolactone decarboxylase family protein [Thiotrichales bacterium 19S3-7]MCF6801184.1 carboxymuconolactone decarboxylase family protein [Thiotrichales bacterium 19S3-11]
MSQPYQKVLEELNEYLAVTYGYDVHTKEDNKAKSFKQSGCIELEPKVKEMIALSLGIAVRCDGCIDSHTKNLKSLGLSRSELLAVLGMAVYIGGGASLMYAADALIAFEAKHTDKEYKE